MADLSTQRSLAYADNMTASFQQTKTKLRTAVKSIKWKAGSRNVFPVLEQTEARDYEGPYQDSPIVESKMFNRAVEISMHDWGDMVDKNEALETWLDPTSDIIQNGISSLNRKVDNIIIKGLLGDAIECNADGSNSVNVPYDEFYSIDVSVGAETAGEAVGLTVEKLLEARANLLGEDIDLDNPRNECFFITTPWQLRDMLKDIKKTSDDYSLLKSLIEGSIDKFCGFKFIFTNQLPIVGTNNQPLITAGSGTRTNIAFIKEAVYFAEPKSITTKSEPRADKSYNIYAYCEMACGAKRIHDEGVYKVYCKENYRPRKKRTHTSLRP